MIFFIQEELLDHIKVLEENLAEVEKKLAFEKDYHASTIKELREGYDQILKESE